MLGFIILVVLLINFLHLGASLGRAVIKLFLRPETKFEYFTSLYESKQVSELPLIKPSPPMSSLTSHRARRL